MIAGIKTSSLRITDTGTFLDFVIMYHKGHQKKFLATNFLLYSNVGGVMALCKHWDSCCSVRKG